MLSREIKNVEGLVKFLLKNVRLSEYSVTILYDKSFAHHRVSINNISHGGEVWFRFIKDGLFSERFSVPDDFCGHAPFSVL